VSQIHQSLRVIEGAVSLATVDRPGAVLPLRAENRYRMITLTDHTATTSAEEHDNAIAYDFPMFSMPTGSAAVSEALT
jgi:hypothetical protein